MIYHAKEWEVRALLARTMTRVMMPKTDDVCPFQGELVIKTLHGAFVRQIASVAAKRFTELTEEDAKGCGLAVLSKDNGQTWKHGIADRDGWPGTDNTGWPWSDWNVDPRVPLRRVLTERYRAAPDRVWIINLD